MSATTSVAINGTAAANEAPVFATNTATRSIAENTAAGENIGAVVSATDGDADTLAYTLSGTNAASFAIVSSSGQLKTKAALNHETKSSYRVTVTASDGDLSDTISVTINVTDVNEMPVFADGSTTTRAIVENTPANRNIGTAVSATDDDRDTLAYTLGGTDAASFDIVSSSGQLKTKTALNHETKSVYRVTVTASDGDLDEAISVTINVTDVNERPVFAEGTTTTRSIAENTSVNQNISTAVSATDEDDGDTLAYTLSGTNAASFNIDSTNGQLKTKVALNHETKSTYSVRITVSDGTVSATISVTINVTDVNEKPVFATNTITYSIVEHTPAGRNIGAPVSATDEDSDDTLTYTLGGTNATSFDLVSTTGQLKTKAALNYDIKNTYSVTITATDEGGLRDAISVTINIINVIGFTDSRLAAAVRSALRIASDAPIRPERLAALTSLTASRRNITDLTGLEQATGLTRLDLGDNQIDDLDPLENLTNLTNLDIANNQIDDVSSLSRLINLTNLDLDDNQIVDVSSLPSLSSLQILDLRSNNVGDVTPLSTMTTLKQLYLSGNENLSNIKFLVDLKAVARTSIDITLPRPVTIRDDNLATAVRTALNNRHGFNLQAGDSIFPEDMERLTELDTSNASITTLTGLETATGLTSLDLSKNTISSISPLSRLTQLESLDLSENTISSISSLSGLTALTDLNLSTNRISSVSSLSRLIGLTRLDLSENTISSLSTLSKLTALTTLYLANNRITDVLALQGLSSLSILDLSGNTGLTTEKAAVLYKLEQVGTIIFLPPGITLPARANIVVFNNAALEAAVRSRLRIRTGYPILTDNITDMTTLTATSKQIDDLTGLAAATGLTRLDLGNNAIVNLTPYRT